jgi:hypothetical protein
MVAELIQIPTTEFPLISVVGAILLILIPLVVGVILYKKGIRYAFFGLIIGVALALLYIPLTFMFSNLSGIFYYQCGLFTSCVSGFCSSCQTFFAPVIIYFEFSFLGIIIGLIAGRLRGRRKRIGRRTR